MIMDDTYLHRQQINKPLFSDVVWSRPVQKATAGKLALIGGSAQGFNSLSTAFAAADKAGAGVIRTLLPDSLKKIVSMLLPESEFAPSTKSGSFAAKALTDWLDISSWADGVIICGDLGSNSETAALLENYAEKIPALLTLAGDSVTILSAAAGSILSNDRLTLSLELSQLQKLLTNIRYPMAVTSQMTLFQLAEVLHAISQNYPWAIITQHLELFFVAYRGEVSTTPAQKHTLLQATASATVWRIQQPAKPFAAMTSGIYSLGSGAAA